MNEQQKLKRLLELMLFLSSGIRYTLKDIATRFEISERTAYRYILTFREAGFIIEKPRDGYYCIDKNSPYFREIDELLHFSKEEAYILQKAIHSINDENLLKHNLVRKLYALYDFERVANTIVKPEHSEHIHQLIRAIRCKNQVLLKGYQSANSNTTEDRLVEPFEFTTNYVATWAYDLEDGCCKTFKNTRIRSVHVLPQLWQNEERHQMKPVDVFRISGSKHTKVVLKLGIRSCGLLKEEYPLAESCIREVGENEYLFEAPVCSFEGVGRFVMGLYHDIKVISPESFRLFLKKKIKNMATDIS